MLLSGSKSSLRSTLNGVIVSRQAGWEPADRSENAALQIHFGISSRPEGCQEGGLQRRTAVLALRGRRFREPHLLQAVGIQDYVIFQPEMRSGSGTERPWD